MNRIARIATSALLLLILALPATADPSAGLSVRLLPATGLAVHPLGLAGTMERSTALDLHYAIFQYPAFSLSAGAMYSRTTIDMATETVVSKLVGQGEVAAVLNPGSQIDLSIYTRAGVYRLFGGGAGFDGARNAAVGGGIRVALELPQAPAIRMVFELGYTRNYGYANVVSGGSGFAVRLLKPRPLDVEDLSLGSVFPVVGTTYVEQPIGSLVLGNRGTIPIEDLSVTVMAEGYMSSPWTCAEVALLEPGAEVPVSLHALFGEEALRVTSDTEVPLLVTVAYRTKNDERSVDLTGSLTMHSRNAITWEDDRRVAAFVTTQDPEVLRLARNVVAWTVDPTIDGLDPALQKATAIHHAAGELGLAYVVDPGSPYADRSLASGEIDFVQFPRQTLINSAGDCDDLSVLYAALLEAVGVDTAFITTPGHIFLAAALERDAAVAADDRFIREAGRVWVPIETTLVGEPFAVAWTTAAAEWRDASERELIPLADARAAYRAPDIVADERTVVLPDRASFHASYRADRGRLARELVAQQAGRIVTRVSSDGRAADLNRLGVLYARVGLYADARERFLDAAETGGSAAAWENLGNLAVLDGDYEAALTWYERALSIDPEAAQARLQIAQAHYELGRYDEAARIYGELADSAPRIAVDHGHLADGDGRRAVEVRRATVEWRE